jgi:hypothetical protein
MGHEREQASDDFGDAQSEAAHCHHEEDPVTKTTTHDFRLATAITVFAAGASALALLLSPAARSAGASITYSPANPTTTSGVSFTVTTGGGNRDFVSIAVNCDNGYSTVLTVEVPVKGTGTSQVIYPPVGKCTADEEKLMQIGKAHILASTSFTVS